ncbi:MAG TPA: PhzF family phenazine biosynthesis protein [Ignavibacteriaceae bacterium]|nr:PhzF family phenazine biosynthesis protein [Ignavibacteriaceae bacterium]
MEKNNKIYQIDAFTEKPFQGNSAAVMFSDNFSYEQMQKIAREMNLSETAFLSPSEKSDYKLQWFTPAVEVELCGHATIASLHFLMENGLLKDNSSVKFETKSGILNCGMKDGFYFMQIPIFKMEEFTGNKKEILNALGVDIDSVVKETPFIILEGGNLFFRVDGLKTLKSLSPDFKALKKLTEDKHEFEGVVVYTLETIDDSSFASSRYFVPYYGIDEDPVTGSTNGPMLLVFKRLGFINNGDENISLIFEQGDFMGRRGRVKVSYDKSKNELYIAGKAVTVLKGELAF